MASIDLFNDFNEEDDAMAGEFDDEDLNRSDDDGNRMENDQEEPEKVEPKIKVTRTKRKIPTLNVERMKGPRGIIAIDEYFQNMKFKGKGYEKQDLDEVLLRMQHWAHRMFPKFNFDDSITAIEKLGKKRELQVHMQRYRLGQLVKDEDKIMEDGDDENLNARDEFNDDAPIDEFEALLDEQIAMSRTNNVSKSMNDKSFGNISTISGIEPNKNFNDSQSSSTVSSQINPQQKTQEQLSEEIRLRIAENKRKAMEILEKRKQQAAAEESLKKTQTQEISNCIIDDDDF